MTMPMSIEEMRCDLFVIGAGFAGMAAAVFAASRGLSTVVAGMVGGIDFSTGLMDVLAVHPVPEGRVWDSPRDALAALRADEPGHPYAKLPDEEIFGAVDEFTDFLDRAGLPYEGHKARNARVLTPLGLAKPTWRVPRGMWPGVAALEERRPCLLVDFHGLKGFSARQIVEVQKPHWPGLRHARVSFPGFTGELYPEHLAVALGVPGTRQALAEIIAPLKGEACCVGFPAVLGLFGGAEVQDHLELLLGVPVFAVPTLPPSLAGNRLRAALEHVLPEQGVRMLSQKTARAWRTDGENLEFDVGGVETEYRVRARGAVLAGGRFFGKGLEATRSGVVEPLFGLPVTQPATRGQWHHPDFFAPGGHAVNRAGIEVDGHWRPLDGDGKVFLDRLFAAGSILAHQDWAREKSGAGLAVSTARAAVESFLRLHPQHNGSG